MPCHAAVSKKTIILQGNETVEDALKKLKSGNAQAAAILDKDGHFEGLFSPKTLLRSLIPVSVAMVDGVQLDIKLSAAPGVAKRLSNIKPLPVLEIMDRKPHTLLPDSPIWEGVGILTKFSGPIVIMDENKKYFGVLTYNSLLEHLEETLPIDG